MLATQYTPRQPGIIKPIHRDINGDMISVLLLVEFCCADWLFTELVFMEIRENTKPVTAEMIGMRNRPMLFQLMPLAQNFKVGMSARFRPRNWKFRAWS